MPTQLPRESWEEMFEKLVEKVTDYGYNDEYGYYNDWADGVRPILNSSIAQILSERDEKLVGEIEKMKINKPYPNASNGYSKELEGEDIGYNQAIDEVINLIKNIK